MSDAPDTAREAGGATAGHVAEGRPRWSAPGRRDGAEIQAILDFRARRALAHFEALAWGGTPRHCPVCDHRGPFSPVRHKPEIWCPQCDSRPRHRLLRLWMARRLALPPGARVLHFAAEPWVRPWFEARGHAYESADLNDRFDRVLDITAMALPDACRDVILANHVLEHVDDRAALAEIHRVLAPGGQAVLTVPLVAGWEATYEDPALDAPARALRYGDADHRRFYGRDFAGRLDAAGFAVETFTAEEPDVSTHALHRGETIFIGRKTS